MKTHSKSVKMENFWGKYENKIPIEVKEMVFDQYYSQDTLFVYCDSSSSKINNDMAVACTYVNNASITVEKLLVHSPGDCIGKNIFGELKAVLFALSHFNKHLRKPCERVIIYSDVNDINRILASQLVFNQNVSLKILQVDLINLYEQKKRENQNVTLEIKYLPLHRKKHNPFMKASHNASRKMLKRE
ncbi:hypothetical protein [Lysinibacillus boronitolerans]|uniref:hypothetical protein n=1 Tax=Lysinibacillus boronitolerans TaxID=309788 RepID=UPI003853593A